MKQIDISIEFRCNECFPEKKSETDNKLIYGTNFMQQSIIVTDGKKEYSDRIVCDKCKKWIGCYRVSKKYKKLGRIK